MKSLKINHSLLFSATQGLFFCVIYLFLFEFLRYNEADTPNFVNAAKMLLGQDNLVETQSRITKPVVLVLPGLINKLWGFKVESIMLFQNIVFVILTAIYFGKLLQALDFDLKKQQLGIFMLFTVQAIAVHSLELINDIAGIFFSVFITYLYFKSLQQKKKHLYFYLLFSLSIVIGILSKESAGMALIIIVPHLLLNESKRTKYHFSISILFSGVLILLVQTVISIYFETHDAFSNVIEEFKINNGFNIRWAQIPHSFDVYWIFIILGTISLIKKRKKNHTANSWLLSGLATIPFLLLWATVQDRTIAVAAPLFIVYILFFVDQYKNKLALYILIIIAGIGNIISTYLIYKHNFNNVLEVYYLSYASLFLFLWLFIPYHNFKSINLKP